MLGDSVTTDHISPAGAIPADSPAGAVPARSTASSRATSTRYGSRRGNHEVMMRGTFANIRLRNAAGARARKAAYTAHLPDRRGACRIYDAAMRYQDDGTPLVVLAGKEYGTGSLAATGPPRARCCWASRP